MGNNFTGFGRNLMEDQETTWNYWDTQPNRNKATIETFGWVPGKYSGPMWVQVRKEQYHQYNLSRRPMPEMTGIYINVYAMWQITQ